MSQSSFLKKLNRRWSKIPISYRGGFILTIPAVCIIAILVSWSELRKEAIAVHREIDRSELTLTASNDLLQLLSGAETGIRGYVTTKQADFLKPYNQAVAKLPNHLEKLKELHQNNPQQQDIATVSVLVEQELDLLAQILKDAQENGQSSQVNLLLDQSQAKMSQITTKTSTFKSEEWKALETQRDNLYKVREATNLAFWSAAIISLISFLAALYLFNLMEQELNQQQQNLRSRATELASLNQALATSNNTLAERNLELDRFSHIVSHDLKAPLRGINNLSEWIEEDLADKLTGDTQKYLHLQRERIARMENLIDGLLQYARVGRKNAVVEAVDVRQLLEEVIDSLNPPPEFAIAIIDKMPIINTQRLYLEQVFSNLIGNAIKHHHRLDGKVTISVQEQKDFYEFAVADDGVGIAPTAQKRIFDIFHTLDKGDSKTNTGIGLAIVKKIVEERGGEITVASEVGKGTTFCFQWFK